MSKRALVLYGNVAKVGPYEAAVRAAGLEPVLRAAQSSVSLDGFSGLLLTGGTDVNPALYGEASQPETEAPDDERDKIEWSLIAESLERDLPLLAICRGLQLFNVYHGGTLIQHLHSSQRHENCTQDRSLPVHQVDIQPDTLLRSIARTAAWQVNSRHHQAVNRIGKGLRVSARDSDDGVIEALERPDKRFALAVQWHPEDQAPKDPEQSKLFQAFADSL